MSNEILDLAVITHQLNHDPIRPGLVVDVAHEGEHEHAATHRQGLPDENPHVGWTHVSEKAGQQHQHGACHGEG